MTTRLRTWAFGESGEAFGRFEILGRLGSGGYGAVFLCRDRESGEQFALKALHRMGPDALLAFKNEFRALSDVQHPNLVRLGELLEHEGQWGFTLEYVPGTDALRWVRRDTRSATMETQDNVPASGTRASVASRAGERGFDLARLRALLVQMAHGLMALHGLGLLHRDVKPENVRVTPEGRVVLLDFGLVVAHEISRGEGKAVGTLAYMAPEQAAGQKLTPAADWYAFGVLLYEALTGRLPFEGRDQDVLHDKLRHPPRRPAAIAPHVPADLDALCMRLLAIAPEERPRGEELLAQLTQRTEATPESLRPEARAEDLFVGREAELETLFVAERAPSKRGTRLVLVEGASGMGKSALVERFTAELALREDVLVLSGRCHAAELVPYKALDEIVDDLTDALRSVSDDAVSAVLPADAHLLPMLFPVLARLPVLARVSQEHVGPLDRYRAFTAFRGLLANLAKTRRIILSIDDLQWADDASIVLLASLLETDVSPNLLIVATLRTGDSSLAAVGSLRDSARATRIQLGPLDEKAARALSMRLSRAHHSEQFIATVATESGGHPLFIGELVRHAQASGVTEATHIDLDSAIVSRARQLEPSARLLLDRAAVAGGPLPYEVLRASTDVPPESLRKAALALRLVNLLRITRRDEMVVSHDRVREALLQTLSAEELAAHHRALALSWETRATGSPWQVAHHFLACGERARALPWVERAAREASAQGAFERAVEHYELLLSEAHEPARRHEMYLALADALARAGRCAESARTLLAAREHAHAWESIDLSVRAAEQLLRAGNVSEGLAAAERALVQLGIAWPKTSNRALLRVIWHRAMLRLNGLEPEESAYRTPEQLAKLVALRRLVLTTAWADLLRSVELGSRYVRLSLKTGDPEHVAHALCWQANIYAAQQRDPALVQRLFARAAQARARVEKPELEAHEAYMRGTAAMVQGDFAETERYYEHAERTLREQCPGAAWELVTVRSGLLSTWGTRGRIRKQAEHAEAWLDDAKLRGDRFARAAYGVGGMGVLRLVLRDQPERALDEIREAMQPWRTDGIGVQHFMEAVSVATIHCYQSGRGSTAFWAATWPHLSGSLLYRMPFMRDSLVRVRLATTLARAFANGADRAILREAHSLVRMLAGGRGPLGKGWARILEAQLAYLENDRAQSALLAREARARFETMSHLMARWADLLVAHSEGAHDMHDRQRRLLDFALEGGAQNPERMVLMLLPAAHAFF